MKPQSQTDTDFYEKVNSIKNTTTETMFHNKKYILSKETLQNGKIVKVYASQAGGQDFISFNMYKLKEGWRLKACEMPDIKVIQFIQNIDIIS
jgi:hypothetical protein